MLDNYYKLNKIYDFIISDVSQESYLPMEMLSNSFFWSHSFEEDKIHLSRYIYCKYSDILLQQQFSNKFFIHADDIKKFEHYLSNYETNIFPLSANITIYELLEDKITEKFIVELTGDKFVLGDSYCVRGVGRVIEQTKEILSERKIHRRYIHDLKNQLMIIASLSANIEEISQNNTVKENAYIIRDTVYGCNYMLSLMDIHKEDYASNKLFNIHSVINSLLAVMNCEDSIETAIDFNAENPRIYGDKILITNVIYNLILNAIQALEHKGKITIKTYNKDVNPKSNYDWSQWLYIEIADDGDGIDAEMLEKIFQISFTTKPTGSGLGLYLSKDTIHNHNGTIDVESVKGKETTFIICLPCHIE